MTAHSSTHEGAGRPVTRNGLVQLGWPQFWLLGSILGGMLALVALVFLVYSWSV